MLVCGGGPEIGPGVHSPSGIVLWYPVNSACDPVGERFELAKLWGALYLVRMGRNPWQDMDPDEVGMMGRRASGMSFGKVFTGLIAIGVLTFVGAYYVPLYRAHTTLTHEHERISGRVRELEQQLASAQTSIKGLETKLSGLAEQQGASGAGLDGVQATLSQSLDRYVKRGGVVVGKEGNEVVIALSDSQVFYPKKVDVSAMGRLLLCDIAKSSGASLLSVRAFDSGAEPGPPLSSKFSTAWALRSARAASIAETLAEKCGVKPARLVASGVGSTAGTTGSSLPPEHIEVRVQGGGAVL